jgi:hypothetical protein
MKPERAPADISQGEWDQHRGELVRISATVATFSRGLKETNLNLDLARTEMRSFRVQLADFKRAIGDRLEKHSDWRETTDQRGRAELEEKLEKYEAKEERRVALWVKIVLGVLAGLVEAGIVHWLHLIK